MIEATFPSESSEFPPDDSLVYKTVDGTALRLHRFLPPGFQSTGQRPVIVFFFGGGWTQGSPAQFYPQCRYLASRGLVAFSAEYRVESRDHTSPRECVQDGKSAIRWIRRHAGELGIDPGRIIAGGGSAGGHVAAAAALVGGFNEPGEDTSADCRPDALVLFNPVFDNGPGGYGHDRVKDYWKEISPMEHIGGGAPPTVVFLGTRDNLVPVATAEKYRRLMEEQGRRCDLHLYEGQGHGFFNHPNTRHYLLTLAATDRFLASLGYFRGNPHPEISPLSNTDT